MTFAPIAHVFIVTFAPIAHVFVVFCLNVPNFDL